MKVVAILLAMAGAAVFIALGTYSVLQPDIITTIQTTTIHHSNDGSGAVGVIAGVVILLVTSLAVGSDVLKD